MSRIYPILLSISFFQFACDDDDSHDNNSTTGLELATAFLGGRAAVEEISGYELTTSGSTFFENQGQLPLDGARETSAFTATVSVDLTVSGLRVDYVRSLQFFGGPSFTDGPQVAYSEVYNGQLGHIVGLDSVLGTGNVAMLTSRLVSGRKQHELRNPIDLIMRVVENSTLAGEAGEETFAGKSYKILEIADDIAPVRLWIDPADGRIDRVTTLVNDFLRRDVELTVTYADWQAYAGIKFPKAVTMSINGVPVYNETRSEVQVNPTFDAQFFELPPENNATFDTELSDFGEHSHQWLQAFVSAGLSMDAPQLDVVSLELAPGVFMLTGASHHSMAVEQDNGVVIVEAPLNPARGEAIIEWASETFPGKAITHVIVSHHHEDHTGGLRAFVAVGATVVMHTSAHEFFRDVVFKAPSTLVPDSLAQTPTDPVFELVPADGSVILADSTRPVEVYTVATSHSADSVMIYIPSADGRFLFQSDLYLPGNGGFSLNPEWSQELLTELQGRSMLVDTLVGGHGGAEPLDELENFVANL